MHKILTSSLSFDNKRLTISMFSFRTAICNDVLWIKYIEILLKMILNKMKWNLKTKYEM